MNTKRARGSLNPVELLRRLLPAPTPLVLERFWAKVERSGEDACWAWTGAKTGNGYGTFKVPKRRYMTVPAHRLAHFVHSGSWPADGQVVRHRCDNPICCNPRHLQLGTQGENIQDQYDRKRRSARTHGGHDG